MKNFLHTYSNFAIGALVAMFIVALFVFSFWTIGDVFTELHAALIAPPPQSATGFDLAGAVKLGL